MSNSKQPSEPKTRKERRLHPRIPVDGLSAVYFEGAENCFHKVREVTAKGAFIETDMQWFEGTCIRMCVRPEPEEGTLEALKVYAEVWCRVARRTREGIGLQFLFASRLEREQFQMFLEKCGVRFEHETRKLKKTILQWTGAD